MADITQILSRIESGDPSASQELLPFVYEELRRLAAAKMAHERPEHTLQATALVHEAYLRLVKANHGGWNGRNHFFGAAAEAMRRILVENARKHKREKDRGAHNGGDLNDNLFVSHEALSKADVLAIDEAISKLAEKSPRKAELVKLRYFLNCSMPETAEILGIAQSTAEADWTFAKAWLRRYLRRNSENLS